jgi:hypothetical protein
MTELIKTTVEHEPDFYTHLDTLLNHLEAVRVQLDIEQPGRRFVPHIHPETTRPNGKLIAAERAVVAHVVDGEDILTFDNQQRLLEAFDLCTPIPTEAEYLEAAKLMPGMALLTKDATREIVESRARFMLTGPDNKPDLRVVVETTVAGGSQYLVTLDNATPRLVMLLSRTPETA